MQLNAPRSVIPHGLTSLIYFTYQNLIKSKLKKTYSLTIILIFVQILISLHKENGRII